jgi:glycosyltransferase involved in cell wall biosynthesis
LYACGVPKGDILLSYMKLPLKGKIVPFYYGSSNYWQSYQIAQIWRDYGYNVDIINHDNEEFVPDKDYKFFIAIHTNFERISSFLSENCTRVFHITEAHWEFNNNAELSRIAELKKRRGTVLNPRRLTQPNRAIETADCATILGNEFTQSTYKFAGKTLYPLPNNTIIQYESFKNKQFDYCKKNYLWFGNGGLIHKGLDLVLEAFSEMPDYHLTVCGPIKFEADFESEYYNELYCSPNITTKTNDWIDVRSKKFKEILFNCVGLVYPSCSEGQSGSVIQCLQGGLIPIISYECGIDVDNFGVILKNNTIDSICDEIQYFSSLKSEHLREMSKNSWEYARRNHTKKAFISNYLNFIDILV